MFWQLGLDVNYGGLLQPERLTEERYEGGHAEASGAYQELGGNY